MKRKTAESVQQQYRNAVEDLESRRSKGKRPAKERTAEALHLLGRPQRDLDVVLVGGTNGKGSTVEMISALLQQKGYSTGTFRSPHIHSVRERIKKDGAMIDRKDFPKLYRRIEALDQELSFFESLTAMTEPTTPQQQKKSWKSCQTSSDASSTPQKRKDTTR
ncbi:MAG: hypothetical protein ABEJ87_04125 [Candidatus Nanohalobium sp.]